MSADPGFSNNGRNRDQLPGDTNGNRFRGNTNNTNATNQQVIIQTLLLNVSRKQFCFF